MLLIWFAVCCLLCGSCCFPLFVLVCFRVYSLVLMLLFMYRWLIVLSFTCFVIF